MSKHRYRVHVYLRGIEPHQPSAEQVELAFEFEARTVDHASKHARERLEANGRKILSLSHSPERVIKVTISREIGPKPLIANAKNGAGK